MTKMWKIYLVGIALFPSLYYVSCDTNSDRSQFDTELLQIMRQISTNLNVISENTERNWNIQFNAEMNKIKIQNRKLKSNLKKILNETATEKKRAEDMGAEMTNIKQEIIKLKNDLDKTLHVTATDKNRSQEMDKILHEKFEELKNLTLNLRKGSITANNQFSINQERINKNILKRIQTLEGRSNTHEVFVNNSLKGNMLEVDLLNASLIKRKLKHKDCGDLKDSDISLHDGVYKIYPDRSEEVSVYCDMGDGGWTVFQRRINGNTDFYRGWNEYRDGFGNPTEEYWLGNKYLHILTRNRTCTLKIELVNIENISRHANYINFQIENEADNFRLRVGNYSGNAGHDSLSYHNNMEFTTKDRDHDTWPWSNCAVDWKGAWWYEWCYQSNLNGEYGRRDRKGVVWWYYPSSRFMRYTTMKIRCK